MEEDFEEEIIDTIRETNIKSAIKSEPVYTLGEMLEGRSLAALKSLAKTYTIKGYTKMSKPDLIISISSELTDIQRMQEVLFITDEIQFGFFKEVAIRKNIKDDFVPSSAYWFLQLVGYIQCYYYNYKIIFVMPDEVKKIFRSLKSTEFYKNKQYFDLINNYAKATTSLYGIITQNDFVDLFNSQNAVTTTLSDIFPILLKFIVLSPGYCLYKEFIVNDEFEENDFKDVYPLYNVIKNKPRYTLPKEEFLKYAECDYFEKTPQLVNLENYINKKITDDKEKSLDIIDNIQFLCAQQAKMQEITDVLESHDIVLKDMKQVREFAKHIIDVMNNTRLWSNNGHTPKELSGKFEGSNLKLVTTEQARSQKIGRNDLCPCGSGKKYKRCCGI